MSVFNEPAPGAVLPNRLRPVRNDRPHRYNKLPPGVSPVAQPSLGENHTNQGVVPELGHGLIADTVRVESVTKLAQIGLEESVEIRRRYGQTVLYDQLVNHLIVLLDQRVSGRIRLVQHFRQHWDLAGITNGVYELLHVALERAQIAWLTGE
jgi:hypothetical protein